MIDIDYRRLTRDLLLEYDEYILPVRPRRTAGLSMIYPWENLELTILSKQILEIAKQYGYTGDEKAFWNHFSEGTIITGTLDTFPIPGNEKNLYFDKESEILYYFKATTSTIYTELAARIGVAIVGTSIIEDTQEVIQYLYIPIRAMPIEDLIIDAGSAAEHMD